MSQMLGRDPSGETKTIACDYDGNVNTVAAPPADFTALIANGASLSGAIDMGGRTLAGIQIPAAWTAADMTFMASFDGVNYFILRDQTGTEVQLTVAANYLIHTTLASWQGIRYLKVRSGTSGAPVNQGADRTITLVAVAAN